jgi:AcrR family transcriptional regulator
MIETDTDTSNTENGNHSTLPDPAALSSSEFNRYCRTRLKILGAGVLVLARMGYKKLSTTGVGGEAGIMRAAMLHYFVSRADLIGAIIRHVIRRGMYLKAVRALPHGADLLERAFDIASTHLKAPEFASKSASKPCRTFSSF